MREAELERIFQKTRGHCHFCGDRLVFKNRGYNRIGEKWVGHWEADHVVQRSRNGSAREENYLPACTRCNRLRWNRRGRDLRELLLIGLIGVQEMSKRSANGRRTETGEILWGKREHRLEENKRRRRQPLVSKTI